MLIPAASVAAVTAAAPARSFPDADSEAWVAALGGAGRPGARRRRRAPARAAAAAPPGSSCAGAARAWTSTTSPIQAADDALVAILAKLSTYRGQSRFTTWAYKFALLEAAVKARRRAWQGREVALGRRRLGARRRTRGRGPGADAETVRAAARRAGGDRDRR